MPAGDSKQKDRLLFITLLILSIYNGYSTVMGASKIIPEPACYVIGILITLMLFLLLSGMMMRHAPYRRLVGVGVFASMSVYTSFAAYYDQLAARLAKEGESAQARQNHGTLVKDIVAPMRERTMKMEAEVATLKQLKDLEEAGDYEGGPGRGPKFRKLAADLGKKQQELAVQDARTKLVVAALDYDVAGKSASEIYDLDYKGWSSLTDDLRANTKEPKRTVYVDAALGVDLLAPYKKLAGIGTGKDENAKPALVLAGMFEGICLLLGTAIEVKRRRRFLQLLAGMMSGLVAQMKDFAVTVQEAWHRVGVPMNRGPLGETEDLEDPVRVVQLRLKGRGSEFLETFLRALDPVTQKLDWAALSGNRNATFALAARMLVDRLSATEKGWLDKKTWEVPTKYYSRLTQWLNDEIVRQLEIETEDAGTATDPAYVRLLKLLLPV